MNNLNKGILYYLSWNISEKSNTLCIKSEYMNDITE